MGIFKQAVYSALFAMLHMSYRFILHLSLSGAFKNICIEGTVTFQAHKATKIHSTNVALST